MSHRLTALPTGLLGATLFLALLTTQYQAAAAGDSGRAGNRPSRQATKPLFKDFMAINGHYTFKPDLYRQVARLARNYHNLNWDVKKPGDKITLPVCVNKVNWKRNLYGNWKAAGFETDICILLGGFGAKTPNYQRLWVGKGQWCYEYGKAMATYFGPSGKEKLCTSIEIGNEPGAQFDADLYRTLFKQMARGIRDGDPKVRILTPTVQARKGDDYAQDLRGIYAEKDILPLYDVINLHTYAAVERKSNKESPWNRSYPEDPEIPYLKVVDEAIRWRDTHAPDKDVWVTEFGYDACTPAAMKKRKGWALKLDWQGTTDLQQAQYLVRSFLVFAERDVRRAYIYYYDDKDQASVHAAAGLTRTFEPKMSFWAIKQLLELLGEYRFKRIVKKEAGKLYVYEFESGKTPERFIWAAWSPTGVRTNKKEGYVPRKEKVTLAKLPALPSRVVAMTTGKGPARDVSWEKAGPSAVTLTVGESPVYVLMEKP